MKYRFHPPCRNRAAGFTITELLVAVALGLILIGGVINVFLTNRQTLQFNSNLARVQENGRFAIEMLSREIRDAGRVPCGSILSANVVRSGGTVTWWSNTYDGTIRGFDGGQNSAEIRGFGTAVGDRVAGTDALLLLRPSGDESDLRRLAVHDPVGRSFTDAASVTVSIKNRYDAHPALVCDGRSAALLQIGVVSVGLAQYDYSTAVLNCSPQLGSINPACAAATGKTFAAGAQITRWDPAFWYIGVNARGGRSLYRAGIQVNTATGAVTTRVDEMVPDVVDLQIDYLIRNRVTSTLGTDWLPASDTAFVAGWVSPTAEVVAARLNLTIRSPESVGADGNPLSRNFIAVGAIRNREL
ncbi:MAG: PilW family protein [Anaerolinea sp.]|nr:PilW family protein [Anaerolinea sp.]